MFFFKKSFTAIDIGSSCIKVVRMKENRGSVKVLEQGYTKLPEETIVDGEVRDISVLTSEIKYLFNEMNFKPSSIVTAVPNQNLVIRNVNLPGVVVDELDDALKWEAEDYLPFPAEEAVLDYIIVDEKEDSVKIVLVATQSLLLHSYKELFSRLNFNLSVVNVQPLGIFSLLEAENKDFSTSAIIDIGSSGSRITIGDPEGIYLYRTMDVGGASFTEVIKENMSVDFQEAEEYKIEHGILSALEEAAASREDNINEEELDILQYSETGSLDELLLSTADDLVYELNRSLEFFNRNNPEKEIENYYLTGGGALLKGLSDFLEDEMDLSLQFLDPFTRIKDKNNSSLNNTCYSVALGLGFSEVLSD
ncbi:MAG: type IV pilus assembly protein PilM [Halanaerobiaceae bacterium]